MGVVMRHTRIVVLLSLVWLASSSQAAGTVEPNETPRQVKAAIIPCKAEIDQALFDSIERRSEIAMAAGAQYLIYQIETYGGRVDSADSIAKYFIQTIGRRAKTVAYVTTEAISAGALISVSCNDIIMRENTTIGDCAPITLGAKLEGVEREKAESFVRAAFRRAAEANGYPQVLLEAMVSVQMEVWRVKNLQTGQWEFFEADRRPSDPNVYDVAGGERIDDANSLLTLTASQAKEYGIARAVVNDVNGVLSFLEQRDGVRIVRPPATLEILWSERMVSWLNSAAVMGVLVGLALLGVYIELSAPGLGLPGLVAVICFVIILFSKYLTGLANWVEIVLLLVGIVLLLIEFFVLPGFGIAGVLGIVLVLFGLFGMLLRNPPGQMPWPTSTGDWSTLRQGALGLAIGVGSFIVGAVILSRYLPKIKFLSGLLLAPTLSPPGGGEARPSMTAPPESTEPNIEAGQVGVALTKLRPSGKARFGDAVVDVVATAEFLDVGTNVQIMEIHGNRVVVRSIDNA
jgi:membrane-bound serine protease (ClpP class)